MRYWKSSIRWRMAINKSLKKRYKFSFAMFYDWSAKLSGSFEIETLKTFDQTLDQIGSKFSQKHHVGIGLGSQTHHKDCKKLTEELNKNLKIFTELYELLCIFD